MANSTPYYFKNIGLQSGLPHSTVECIIQDRYGFIWFGTPGGLCRYDGQQMQIFDTSNSGISNSSVKCLYEDNDGTIWIGTSEGVCTYIPSLDIILPFDRLDNWGKNITNSVTRIVPHGDNIYIAADYQGLFRYSHADNKLERVIDVEGVPGNQKARKLHNPSHIWFRNDKAYIGLYSDNLYVSDSTFANLTPFTDNTGREIFKNHKIFTAIDFGTDTYIGSSEGLIRLDQHTLQAEKVLDAYVRGLCLRQNELWVATENGIYVLDSADKVIQHLTTRNSISPYALSDNAVYVINQDNEGGLWIGTYFGGINYCMPDNMRINIYSNDIYPEFGRRVRRFCKSNDGTIWIGTEDRGLFNFNPATQQMTPFRHPQLHTNIHGLCTDGDTLWVGTFAGGLNKISLTTGKLTSYTSLYDAGQQNGLLDNSVEVIHKLKSGTLLFGTGLGLMRYDRERDRLVAVKNFPDYNITDIHETADGKIWISTYANGVFDYDIDNNLWKNYRHTPDDTTSLPSNRVVSIFEDSGKRLWFLTQGGGLCRYNPDSHIFTTYNTASGMPCTSVYGMHEDSDGMLWFTTARELMKFNPETGEIIPQNFQNGLLTTQFNYASSLKSDDGSIYFGSINGFISFKPEELQSPDRQQPIFITQMEINGKTVTPGSQGSPLHQGIMLTDNVTLNADQNSITFKTSALSFSSGNNRDIRYRLEGLDETWHKTQNGIISFIHIPPGRYTLRLHDFNAPDSTTDRVLAIRINPPFYLSPWAYTLYFLMAVGLGFLGFRLFKRRMERRQRQLIENIAIEKERELNAAKISFFTNVTHEIRNPLTLIKGPLEKILESNDIPQEVRDDLQIMELNTSRLLDLVNQLLDFHSADSDKANKAVFHRENVGKLLLSVYTCFRTLASQRGLTYEVTRCDEVVCGVDKEAIVKLLSNLIANAIKYTDTYIKITLVKNEKDFTITIDNDGDLIPANMHESIFQPFVRCEEHASLPGSGIGLPLARKLATLHSGTLVVDSQAGCNRFVVTIPLDLPVKSSNEIAIDSEKEPEADGMRPTTDSPKETALIVEDQDDVRAFIAQCLRPVCKVVEAADGEAALAILNDSTSHVSLIVSDVGMPNIDGLELTRRVKSSSDLNHLPVVLLTAQTDLKANIDGINAGADLYVQKPFSPTLLRTMVTNLLESRRRLRAAFASNPGLDESQVEANAEDHIFIGKLNETIDQNLCDEDFDLDSLAGALGMSRSSLNRKIKYYMDMTPNDYIRLYRLKKAAELLKSRQYRVNEVCFMVGFKTPSYFAKCFLKQFGISPSLYQ